MIVATAGHVDHGKTSLVRALTGVDTDTLAEEKRRGMSIDLGFAYMAAGKGPQAPDPIGFVDVPGHQGFIRNTLAGLMAVDQGLLVVAADDGPMPQTLEHLAILTLLQVPLAAIVLTKIDCVPPARTDEVSTQIATLLQSLDLPAPAVFQTAAPTGAGVDALKDHLRSMARGQAARAVHGNFRLSVDRAFSVAGAGLVVTGTVASGRLRTGEAVQLLGTADAGKVRGMHVHQRPAEECRAGQRTALNLSGELPAAKAIARGSWVVAGDPPEPQRRIDVELRVLPGGAPLKHWSAVHVHLAADELMGRIALLEGMQLEAGGSALAQLVLDKPLAAVQGDRFIVRDASARRTLAGGRVLDMFPPARGRSRPERLQQLRLIAMDDAGTSLRALVEAAPAGVLLEPMRRNRNLTADEFAPLLAGLDGPQLATSAGPLAFSARHWAGLRTAALQALQAWHERAPAHAGPSPDRILAGVRHGLPRDAVLAVAAELVREGVIVRRGMAVALPSHAPRLSDADQVLWEQVAPLLAQAGLRPPSVSELSYALRADSKRIGSMLACAAQCGHAIRVSSRHYYLPEPVLALAQAAQELAQEDPAGCFTAAAYRDRSGLGRNLAIEVLEFFDQVRFTRRLGSHHAVIAPAREVFTAADAAQG